MSTTLTAFQNQQIIATGSILALINQVKEKLDPEQPVFVFNDQTGKRVEIHFSGQDAAICQSTLEAYPELSDEGMQVAEIATPSKPRGRPKLGVTAKEITLLPRQRAWLATQPGGASVTIRRLVDEAKNQHSEKDLKQKRLEAAYTFLHELAANLPQYEESLRALFADDYDVFSTISHTWPVDIKAYAIKLAFKEREHDGHKS